MTEEASSMSGAGGAEQTAMGGEAGSAMTAEPAEEATGPALIKTYGFEADVEGFRISYYCDRPAPCETVAAPVAPVVPDAGVAAVGDAGSDADAAAPVMIAAPPVEMGTGTDFVGVTHDAAVGEPDEGSLRVDILFAGRVDANDANLRQSATLTVNMDALDLTGRAVSAQVMSDVAIVAKMYVKTGDTFSYADSGELQIPAGVWTTVSFLNATYVDNRDTYDISEVRELGLELLPGLLTDTAAVIHVDTLTY